MYQLMYFFNQFLGILGRFDIDIMYAIYFFKNYCIIVFIVVYCINCIRFYETSDFMKIIDVTLSSIFSMSQLKDICDSNPVVI